MSLRKRSFTSRLNAFLSSRGAASRAASPSTRRARGSRPGVEALEERQVLSGYTPTPQEQLFLERLNDARANPAAYGASIGVDLSSIPPSQPLAFDPRLIQSSRDHSQDMNINNYFGHTGSDGSLPFQRMTADGFPWVGAAESISAGQSSPEAALQALITDAGVPDLGHQKQLLSWGGVPYTGEQETGVGIVLGGTGSYHNYYTIDSGYTADTRPILTGDVFNDTNGNGKYDIGEELGGVTITIAGVGSTTTWSTGGYSYQLSPGTYTVTASGGGLSAPITRTITVGSLNYRLNFINGSGSGGGSGAQYADDGDTTDFSLTGSWTLWTGMGYDGQVHQAAAGTGSAVATWTFTVKPGTYQVAATWVANANRADNSPFTVLDGSTPLGTVNVNQKVGPSDFSDAGFNWKKLGTFTVTGTTLVVQLSNNADGYLNADAIRIQPTTGAPTAAVYDGSTLIANGGSDSFGTTPPGTPVTKTFTVKNTGGATLTLSDPINVPSGFSLVSDFGTTTLAPGASTTFSVKLTAAAVGTYSGTVSFGTNDSSNNPYAFTVSGTVQVPPSVQYADDGDTTDFSTVGSWTQWTGFGFHNQVHQGTPGTSSDKATWTFSVTPGTYKVAATWVPNANRADNAPFSVLDGGTSLGTVNVNQKVGPADFSDQGVNWKTLGTFTVTSSTLVVQLSNNADGYLNADGIRIQSVAAAPTAAVYDGSTSVPNGGSDSFGSTLTGVALTRTFTVKNTGGATLTLSDPINLPAGFALVSDFGTTSLAPGASTTFSIKLTAAAAGTYSGTVSFGTNDSGNNPYAFTVSGTVTNTAIVDDGDPTGFSMVGSWTQWTGLGYDGQIHQGSPGTGSDYVTWTFNVAPGTYQVAATWAAFTNRADNAPYTVLDGTTPLGTVNVNQKVAPADFSDQGVNWKTLGTFTATGNTLVVRLSNNADGYLNADAIRIQKVS